MAERVSAGGLARSVAHRLKYYIDVQRKEDSFDLPGPGRNETESSHFYMQLGSITEQKYDQCLEHNFTNCKFEASLRMYTGNSEECERKLKSNTDKQLEMKIIKKIMAQEFATDRHCPVLLRSTKRTKKLHRLPQVPPPYTSREVTRLISSASKLIVAATNEISSEEVKKLECASSQKRKEATDIQSIQENKFEQSNADFIQEDPRNDYGKNLNKGKKGKSMRNLNGVVSVERSSQHKSVLSKTSKRAIDLSSLYWRTTSAFAQQTDRSKGVRKSLHNKGKTPALCSSSVMGECQDTEPRIGCTSGLTNFAHAQKNECKSSEFKRQKSPPVPSRNHSGSRVSKSSKLSQKGPMENSRNIPPHPKERKLSDRNRELNEKIIHTVSTAKVTQVHTPMIHENAGELTASAVALNHNQNNTTNSLKQRTQSNQCQKEEEGEDFGELATEKNTKPHQVHFQGPLQFFRKTEQKSNRVNNSCSMKNEYGIQTTALENKLLGPLTHLQEDQNEECLPRVRVGAPSFLHQVFLEMEQDAPPTSTVSELKDMDSSLENESIQQLSNQLFTLNESTGDKKVQHASSTVHTSDILTEPGDQKMAHIPQKPYCCRTCTEQRCNFISETSDEEQDSFSDSSVTVTSILGTLERQLSEDEFTVSSVSDSWSFGSLADVHEQMEENESVDLKKKENSDSSIGYLDQSILEEMQKISNSEVLSQTDSFHLSSTDEEGRSNMDHALKSDTTHQVQYFSHFPHYIST